jgi:hypothetical protein
LLKAENLLGLFGEQRYRDETFCHFLMGDVEQAISFRSLFGAAGRFRDKYAAAGIEPGSVIIIATEFSPESLYAFVGALIGGFVPAFLAPLTEKQHVDQFARTISSIIAQTRPGGIVVTAGAVERLSLPIATPGPRRPATTVPGRIRPWTMSPSCSSAPERPACAKA